MLQKVQKEYSAKVRSVSNDCPQHRGYEPWQIRAESGGGTAHKIRPQFEGSPAQGTVLAAVVMISWRCFLFACLPVCVYRTSGKILQWQTRKDRSVVVLVGRRSSCPVGATQNDGDTKRNKKKTGTSVSLCLFFPRAHICRFFPVFFPLERKYTHSHGRSRQQKVACFGKGLRRCLSPFECLRLAWSSRSLAYTLLFSFTLSLSLC